MKEITALGIDIGASSGRGIAGKFDGELLTLEELYRFQNRPVTVLSGFYWNILSLFDEVKTCIYKATSSGNRLLSIGVDTWAQDFGLLDRQGNMLGNPHHYRDHRTEGILDKYKDVYSEYELFIMTGMLPYKINTLFQLLAMKIKEKALIENADSMLFIADLLNYFLTGNKGCNNTLASVSLIYNQFTQGWDEKILSKFSIPPILPEVTNSGMHAGYVTKDLIFGSGMSDLPVISVAAHDTASAIVSIPAKKDQVIYISCGTWSTIGTETEYPVVNKQVYEYGFCNELGYDNRFMFVKNITGLWVLQECISEWVDEGYCIDYDYMDQCTEKSQFNSAIDLDYEEFGYKGNMCSKIIRFLTNTKQPIPESKEDIYRCVVLSLALKYQQAVDQLESLMGKKYESISIIGGGARNKALCRLIAKLTGKYVYAGPYEATVIGNILVQLIAMGELKNKSEAQIVVKRSIPLVEYGSQKSEMLYSIYQKYLKLIS